MSEVLDLDSLLTEERPTIKLNGKTHAVRDIPVQELLEIAEKEKSLKDKPEGEILTPLIEIIKRFVPELPEEELKALGVATLFKVIRFINKELNKAFTG